MPLKKKKTTEGLPTRQRPGFDWNKSVLDLALPVGGVLVALLIGGIMLVVLNANPVVAYTAMVTGAGGCLSDVTQSQVKTTPLLLVGLNSKQLHVMGDRGSGALREVDLEIHAGEIVGLAGVSGNGQRELAECLAGIRKVSSGKILLGNQEITSATVNQRVEAGLAFIPEERMRDGAIREFSVEENISCTTTPFLLTPMGFSWISRPWLRMPATLSRSSRSRRPVWTRLSVTSRATTSRS